MLVKSGEIFKKAKVGRYAVGSFNTSCFEITKAILLAAEETGSPVMIETSEGEAEYLNFDIAASQVKTLIDELKVPVALHLDHGKSLKSVEAAIAAGYTSIHIDGSALSFEENVALTKEAVKMAKKRGLTVEGEIGHVSGSSQHHKKQIKIEKETLTDPDLAVDFVKKTGVDILAVAIGNIHGVYQNIPQLDFKRLAEIAKKTGIFLSLHGGSGIPKSQIKEAIRLGITKVNVNTELRMAFKEGILHEFEVHPDEVVPYKYLPAGTEAVKKVVEAKMRLFGCVGRVN